MGSVYNKPNSQRNSQDSHWFSWHWSTEFTLTGFCGQWQSSSQSLPRSWPSPSYSLIDSLSYYISLIDGQPELHKFTSTPRETYCFHGVIQSFPLLEWHRHLAPSPVVIAGSALFISQNLLCLLQFLKSLHWKTKQKISASLLEQLNFQTIILILLEYVLLLTNCVTLGQFTSSNSVSSFVKCIIRTNEIM